MGYTGKQEPLTEPLNNPPNHNAFLPKVASQIWSAEPYAALCGHGSDQEPFGTKTVCHITCQNLGPNVAPEKRRQDGTFLSPMWICLSNK